MAARVYKSLLPVTNLIELQEVKSGPIRIKLNNTEYSITNYKYNN